MSILKSLTFKRKRFKHYEVQSIFLFSKDFAKLRFFSKLKAKNMIERMDTVKQENLCQLKVCH